MCTCVGIESVPLQKEQQIQFPLQVLIHFEKGDFNHHKNAFAHHSIKSGA